LAEPTQPLERAGAQHGETGRVIPSILQASQPLHQDRRDVTLRNRTDDAAHDSNLPLTGSSAAASTATASASAALLPLLLLLLPLLLLLRPLPARHGRLPRPLERQLAGRRVLRDRRAGADRRVGADLDRRNEHNARADESAVADHGSVLRRAVVVAGDRAGADVHVAADRRVADVRQMVDLRAFGGLAVLHFDEVADLHSRRELGAGANSRERPELATVAGRKPADYG